MLQKLQTAIKFPKREPEVYCHQRFRKIYEDHFERLCAYAFVITNSRALAKDVVSDVFFSLWKSKTNFDEIKDLKAYLFRAVKNQAINSLPKNTLNFDDFDHSIDLLSIERLNPEDLMIGEELAGIIDRTLEAMPPHCQLVFKMVKEDNLKYEEVAQELGISINTVKHHMVTALKKMRQVLERHFADAPVYELVPHQAVPSPAVVPSVME